ncbi:MAG: hypothetical protein V1779_13020 [bacterium]
MNYPVYDIVDENNLQQGDLIKSCPIIIPPNNYSPNEKYDVDTAEYDVVVMSQSCDLKQDKIDIILVCPYYPFNFLEEQSEYYRSLRGKEELRKGLIPGYHLLHPCDEKGFETNLLFVDFRNIFGVHKNFLKEHVKKINKRIRLLPPYREHLSQAFARYFMRVGLPIDIPPFKKGNNKTNPQPKS